MRMFSARLVKEVVVLGHEGHLVIELGGECDSVPARPG